MSMNFQYKIITIAQHERVETHNIEDVNRIRQNEPVPMGRP